MSPFLVVALPRSGTAWLSCALNCHHELSGKCETMGELIRESGGAGNCDPCGALIVEPLAAAIPDLKIVYLVRDYEECLFSFSRVSGLTVNQCKPAFSLMQSRMKSAMDSRPGMVIRYSELQNMGSMWRLWGYLHPGCEFPEPHFEKMMTLRIEQNPALIRNAALHGGKSVITAILHEQISDNTVLA